MAKNRADGPNGKEHLAEGLDVGFSALQSA